MPSAHFPAICVDNSGVVVSRFSQSKTVFPSHSFQSQKFHPLVPVTVSAWELAWHLSFCLCFACCIGFVGCWPRFWLNVLSCRAFCWIESWCHRCGHLERASSVCSFCSVWILLNAGLLLPISFNASSLAWASIRRKSCCMPLPKPSFWGSQNIRCCFKSAFHWVSTSPNLFNTCLAYTSKS